MNAQRQTDRRTEWLKVRLTPAEHVNLVRKAEEAGMTRSELMRDHLGRVTVANREDHRAWVREVARIGSNLNQLARWVNTYKRTAEALPILRALRSPQRDGALLTQARAATSRRVKLMAVVKFAQSGQGGGRNVVVYLVEKDRVQGAEVLRGTPQITEALIDSSPHTYTYDHAIVSFSEADSQKLGVRDLEAIMGDFESFAFAGLARDQVDVLWVRHRDKGRKELHALIPRLDLHSGKSLTVDPPRWKDNFHTFEDVINHRYGLDAPGDPDRARSVQLPPQTYYERAANLRAGTVIEKDPRELLNAFVESAVRGGSVHDRSSLVAAIQARGFEVPWQGKVYITVLDPIRNKRWRLKGPRYAADWTASQDHEHARAAHRAKLAGAEVERQAALYDTLSEQLSGLAPPALRVALRLTRAIVHGLDRGMGR